MSGGPLASVEDLEAVWRPLDDDERTQASRLIDLASSLVRDRLPSVDARVAADPTGVFGDVLTTVVAGMVVRVMVNPDGLSQRTEGPFSATFAAGPRGVGLYLAAEDLAALAPRAATGLGGIYTVPLG